MQSWARYILPTLSLSLFFLLKKPILVTNSMIFWTRALVSLSKSLPHSGTPVALPLQNFCTCTLSPSHWSTSISLSNLTQWTVFKTISSSSYYHVLCLSSSIINMYKVTPSLTLSPIARLIDANLFNANSSQKTASSTGLILIRPTLIPLLSSSIFSRLKINGLQLTSPKFIQNSP